MIRKIAFISIFALLLQTNLVKAGSTGSEELKGSDSKNTADECFEGFSRAMFKLNHGLDTAIFEPVAKGYRALPAPIRKGTGNVVDNLRSLLTFSNNILQGDFLEAGNTAARFAVNSTVGILGIFDPAAALGLEDKGKEDFGQTMGAWGIGSGCYFVLPILGPTTVRDTAGKVGNFFLDPVYHVTHNSEIHNSLVGNSNYSEHNYYYYRGTGAVEIIRCEDYGPGTKLLGSLNKFEKDSLIILVDDDHVYEDYMIEKFFYFYSQAPNNAYSFYVHPLGNFGVGQGADGFAISSNSLDGVKKFYDEVVKTNKDLFIHDDLWTSFFLFYIKKIKILSLQPHLRKNLNNEILPIYKKHSHYNGLIESYGKNINEAVRNRDQIALESFKYMQKKTKGLSF